MATNIPSYLPSVGRLVTFASQVAAALTDQQLEGSGVTRVQWVVLSALLREDGLTIRELARYLRVTDPAASRLVGRMEEKGLVVREADPSDRRVVRIRLTQMARSKKDLLGMFQEVNQIMMEGFTPEEQDTLLALLERLVRNGEAALGTPIQASRLGGVPGRD